MVHLISRQFLTRSIIIFFVIMDEELLIEYVKNQPFLFDKREKDFKNTMKKEAAWLEISEMLACTPHECKKRWTSLRDRFTREKRLRELPSGSGRPNTQSWHLYDAMDFLSSFLKPRKTYSNMDTGSPTSDSSLPDVELQVNLLEDMSPQLEVKKRTFNNQQHLKKSKRTSSVIEHVENELANISNALMPINNNLDSDVDYTTSMSLYASLRSLSSNVQKVKFRRKIRQLVDEIEDATLAEEFNCHDSP